MLPGHTNGMNNVKQIKHLFSRAGFGLRFEDLTTVDSSSVKHAVKSFLDQPGTDPLNLKTSQTDLMTLLKADGATKKMIVKEEREEEKDLNLAWINKLINTNAVLQEKMTLFWHNHFACRSKNAGFAQQLNNIQRANALGNFKTMLFQVAESPAMLQFLNNQQNQKNHPNENFAREVMELFTVGRGNYSETGHQGVGQGFYWLWI